jgi:hypothetical protein
MSSHATKHACPFRTLLLASMRKCSTASGESADLWGPCSTACVSSDSDHGCPVIVGHPYEDHSLSRSPAVCVMASREGSMFGWLAIGGGSDWGRT